MPAVNLNHAILFLVKDNFGFWLQQEREKIGLSQAELARLSGLNRAVISKVENNASDPTPETLSAIARALRLPPETVFRIAGLLPPVPPNTEQTDELLYLFAQLPDNQKPIAVDYIRFLVEKNEARNQRQR